jgi:hypothetical protein
MAAGCMLADSRAHEVVSAVAYGATQRVMVEVSTSHDDHVDSSQQ